MAPAKKSSPTAIDWEALRRRLAAARMALGREMTPAEQQTILKSRALTLAREPVAEKTGAEQREVLEFRLADETYGIETSFVRETLPLKELTPLPGTPPFVLGLINIRGRILSVLDLKQFFALPDKGLTDLNKVILLHDGEMEFGILADAIIGVRSIPLAEIQPPLATLTGVRAEYLQGISRKRTVILDGATLLHDRNLVVNDEE
jgi:purine-binding chemotaxis protein CheW